MRRQRLLCGLVTACISGAAAAQAPCIDESITPAFEEQRLVNMLPGTTVPAPRLIMEASGFDKFGPDLIRKLCASTAPASLAEATGLANAEGRKLWRTAVDRAQGKHVEGSLPRSDDRPLYWARLTMRKALRQWQPGFAMTPEQRAALIYEFERHSRGQYEIDFPAGPVQKRILVSGFDPFSLGNPGSISTGVRIGNPSGAVALSLDGQRLTLADGTKVAVETYILPVNYTEFDMGMVEDTVAPHMQPGPKRVDASISVSQGGGFAFNLEHWNGRFHGPSAGNDGGVECPGPGSARLPYSPAGCNVYPPQRWLGYNPRPCTLPVKECWIKDSPPQFVAATLPFDSMMRAPTGKVGGSFQRPPGDTWPVQDEVYGVLWGTDYSYYPNCDVPVTASRNPTLNVYPPATLPIPPGSQECARQGAGGDYLSNEVAYRNTLMRDTFGLKIPAGHIHVPVMTRFGTNTNPGNGAPTDVITDATFEAYRDTIVEQTRRLIFVVGQNLNEGVPPVGLPPN
jgi:pyrrolidone-carboxylate peptidase